MAVASYKSVLLSTGIPTSFTDESTNDIGNRSFQISDVSKQILDRNTDLIVDVDNVLVADTEYSVDYLFGIVTFNTAPTGVVTVSGKFLPSVEITGANQYSLEITGDVLDDTEFNSHGFRTKSYGLTDVSLSLSRFAENDNLRNRKNARDSIVIEIDIEGEKIRGWFKIESANLSGDVSSLESEELSFQLDGDIKSSFSWR